MPSWYIDLLAGLAAIAVIASLLVLREAYRDRVALKRQGINSISEMIVATGLISQLIRVLTTLGAMAVFGAVIILSPGTSLRTLLVTAGTTTVVAGLALDGVYDLVQRRRQLAKLGTPHR